MSIDCETLLRKGRDLIAQGKITCEESEAVICNSKRIIARSLHRITQTKRGQEVGLQIEPISFPALKSPMLA